MSNEKSILIGMDSSRFQYENCNKWTEIRRSAMREIGKYVSKELDNRVKE